MSTDFDFPPLNDLPVQRAFLQALVPCLASAVQVRAIWLAGSLARGDADRWSSVDLFLQWREECTESAAATSPSRTLKDTLKVALGESNAICDPFDESEISGCLRGISLNAKSPVDPLCDTGAGSVLFNLFWTFMVDAEGLERETEPLHPLYLAEGLANNQTRDFNGNWAAIDSHDPKLIDRQLDRFWLLLARLPAVVMRQEQLAAHALLTEMRTLLIDLVVSLNGARRPQTSARINQFLGQAQREAFERTLGSSKSALRGRAGSGFNWIGQAVAMVVLYRWYAPQLAERHSLHYPRLAEKTVLTLLSTELENWPSHITTG